MQFSSVIATPEPGNIGSRNRSRSNFTRLWAQRSSPNSPPPLVVCRFAATYCRYMVGLGTLNCRLVVRRWAKARRASRPSGCVTYRSGEVSIRAELRGRDANSCSPNLVCCGECWELQDPWHERTPANPPPSLCRVPLVKRLLGSNCWFCMVSKSKLNLLNSQPQPMLPSGGPTLGGGRIC